MYLNGIKSDFISHITCGAITIRKVKTAKYGSGVLSKFRVSLFEMNERKITNPKSPEKYFPKNASPKNRPKRQKYINL
jgi:hypothetical protein